MQSAGIPTAVHYPVAMHNQKALSYLNYQTGDFPYSETASNRVISLPMHPYLQVEEQIKVVSAVKNALESQKEKAVI
jgi:UDP-2-acetamido-2-deoxy-ribo-hexuluronate aminotransferase